ncbi:unnamed protein product [Urochloa humidicola]
MVGSDLKPLRADAAALPSSSDPDSPATPRRSCMRELLRSLDRRLSNRSRASDGAATAGHGSGGEAGAAPKRSSVQSWGEWGSLTGAAEPTEAAAPAAARSSEHRTVLLARGDAPSAGEPR